MHFKYCANLIEYLKKIINSENFINKHKQTNTDFTRQRKLPFQTLLIFFLNLLSGSYQKELDNFFKTLMGFSIAKRIVTKAALSKARLKLKYEAFIELNQYLVGYVIEHFIGVKKWCGFNVRVVDGTTLRLPRVKEIVEHFGAWHPLRGDECPMARASQLYDPLNHLTVDAIISPKAIGERELAAQHFQKLTPKDLVLLDRGYPAYWLFKLIQSKKANFCVRVSNKGWKVVRKFVNSGKLEKVVSLPVMSSRQKCHEMGLDVKPLTLRLLRVELPTGEIEVLITSLLDKNIYPHDIFLELYHQRWFVEEDYKTIKCWIEVENFTGKTPLSVYQDFHARVLSKNLAQSLSFPANEIIHQDYSDRKYCYRINFAHTLSSVKNTVIMLFTRSVEAVHKIIDDLTILFSATVEPIRPGRKFERKLKPRKIHYMNYKPIG